MPLHFPNSLVLFQPNPRLLLGPLDIYDREESLGVELARFDPGNETEAKALLQKHVLPCFAEERGFTVEHRAALALALAEALASSKYDFQSFFDRSGEEDEFTLPSSWNVSKPRQFVFWAYSLMQEQWGQQLSYSGVELPDANAFAVSA